MKHLILSIITIVLYSCNHNTVSIPIDEYRRLTNDTIKPKKLFVGNKTFEISLGSDKHDYYLILIDGFTNYWHYPDCEKCQKINNVKYLQFPEISRLDTQYFVRAPRRISPLHKGHEYLVQDTAKWLNDVVKPAILQNKIFISNIP